MDYGAHRIDSPKVRQAVALMAKVFGICPVGGNLHVVIGDWNLDDESLQWAEHESLSENLSEHGPDALATEWECLEFLKGMTFEERVSAFGLYCGFWSPSSPFSSN